MDRVQRGARLGPADRVTATRAALAVGVAVLTVRGLVVPLSPRLTAALVGMSAVALALDAVDGYVARRTGTASPFGARFDMETDAFLIAVLSVHVAPQLGWWVLAIGAMRYAYVLAGRALPWLRGPTPPRYWAKVVAAVQGIVLTVASSTLLPPASARTLLALALLLLVESFGHDVVWLWRHRYDAPGTPLPAGTTRPSPRLVTLAAVAALWVALAPPHVADGIGPADFARIPVEGVVLVALAVVLPTRGRRVLAVLLGAVVTALAVLRGLGLGFDVYLGRPFHVLGDWSYLPKGYEVVRDTQGGPVAVGALVGVVALVAALAAVLTWAAARVAQASAEHPRTTWRALTALGTVWVVCATFGGPVDRVAAAGSAGLVVDTVDQVRADRRDTRVFARELATDAYARTPGDQLLLGLRGKDVLLVWFESYGRVAVEDSWFAPSVVRVLQEGDRELAAAGYHSRSAFLTSPTFGAGSWLAHATLQSGAWTNSERRYGQLLGSVRLSLTRAFASAGWRTVFDVPANTRDWPDGAAYYGFDQLYDSRNVGYRGPRFGYAPMPDQYTLDHLRRTELTPGRRAPVFAEVDLISSHHPWAPVPEPVPWADVGDGSVYAGMPARGADGVDGRRHPRTAQRDYAASVRYTWRTLISFLTTYPDPDRVVVIVGDHQPHSYVSGRDPGHDVPITVLAQDPASVARIDGWGWQPGILPSPDAPVWRMDTVRDRFLAAYAR
ncbi:CDP-alcohol phosphatidyltransferase family protein [Nocardioides daeguensis]|uniref:CDP-alcohol phosphatidyltransferase family protein n=1 Tax=Nocardioides daeguensis TaxID=908359 RepID=A0ABP6VCC9_9ACTN|nr:CDP-alcohol phosphatidyltransferase family protein [Nocardioides daeguensis]MBV6729465.1 CDP-alcohol phosphatidyltransferase family protein [Nocardioides daeguensis]MCR1771762.1 CDP-alcohol phosphatidyltransferase family protein [Nocardioides daeguensis]